MTPNQFRVRSSESGNTLIDLLSRHLKVSRTKAKALIDKRCVFVNSQRIWMARHKLQTGDKINVMAGFSSAIPGLHKTGMKMRPPVDNSIILFQDSDILIANKPAGILANGPKSLESDLRTRLENPTLTAVHRLDKDTSGCLLFAKHAEAESSSISLFSKRSIRKIYHAIVNGIIKKPELTITKPVESQSAVTRIRVLDANQNASHLRITIETGRTHQIRKHLTAIRHPILGDQTYATSRYVQPLEQAVPRQMLHAFQLIFTHPMNGNPVRCTAPLPDDFRKCLKQYRLK